MKGKRRNRNNKPDRNESAVYSTKSSNKANGEDDGSDISDSESCDTTLGINDDVHNPAEDGDGEDAAISEVVFCERLSGLVDRATHKNLNIRVSALAELVSLLMKYNVSIELQKWKATMIGLIEKALKKSDDEAVFGTTLAALMSIQLSEEVSEELESALRIMCQLCTDEAKPHNLRIFSARAITICSFLSALNSDLIAHSANTLRSVWINTKLNATSNWLFSIALSGWSFLISQAGHDTLKAALLDEPKLCFYVGSAQLEIRLMAGEALALLHEAAVATFGEDYRFPNEDHLLEMISTLSNDSLKFRGKRDKREQKTTFRQIYTSIKEREVLATEVRFADETLYLETCVKKKLYAFMCETLRGCTNTHLRFNTVLREWFDLGPVLEKGITKIPKPQRVAIQNAISKTRDLKRSKQRDKRIDHLLS